MKAYWIIASSVFGLLFVATLVAGPPANGVMLDEIRASISIEQLTANAKDLPVQSFDGF